MDAAERARTGTMSGSREQYRTSYRFGALERRGMAGTLRTGQVVLIGASCLFAIAVFRRLPNVTGLVLALISVLAACLATWLPIAGRTFDEWAPILVAWALHRHKYASDAPRAGARVNLSSRTLVRPTELPPPLDRVVLEAAPLADGRELGVFADRRAGTYTALAVVRVRSFGLLAAADQERRLERWGQVLASMARDGGSIRRIQIIERTLPHDEDQLRRWLDTAGVKTVPEDALRSYEGLISSAADVTQDHEVLLAVQTDPRRGRAPTGTRLSRDELGARLAMREMCGLAERLQSTDAGVVGLLSPAQCAWTLRLAYAPHERARYSSLELPDPGQLGPTGAETSWDRYRCDDELHRTYWIAQWPRLEVGPAFLAPVLLSPTAVRSFSVVVEPVPPARARLAIEAAVTSDEADEELRRERGFRTTARRRKQQAATRRREAELAEGHEELRFAGFITVSGRDDDELERNCDEVTQAAQQAYLDLQPMWGQQDTGFACGALPLCHGLAPARLLDR
jgi:hypothetical protein